MKVPKKNPNKSAQKTNWDMPQNIMKYFFSSNNISSRALENQIEFRQKKDESRFIFVSK